MSADEPLSPGLTVEHGGDLLNQTTAVFNPGPERTQDGMPGHPLYLPKTAPLLDYAPDG